MHRSFTKRPIQELSRLRNRFHSFIGQIKKNGLWYEPRLKIDILEDKDDNKFIELAVEADAAYIVTGNSNDFVIKIYNEISICSPKEFYENQISS
jgi:putative PIN family toxin of toxin-antitoxin system